MNREEHKLEGIHLELLERLIAAKETGDPAKIRRAAYNLEAFRVWLRSMRDRALANAGITPGTAQPSTVTATASATKKAGH